MPFIITQKVLFKHCDPAGIVFYPRYFEMINDCIEMFFDTTLGHPFETILTDGGVPTVHIETDFTARSSHGDVLTLDLRCMRVGASSLNLRFTAHCDHETRLNASMTLVYVGNDGRPRRWPASLRKALEQQAEGDA